MIFPRVGLFLVDDHICSRTISDSLPPYHLRSCSMSDIGTIGEIQTRKEIGTLFDSELWWRDCYHEIENHGYRLRPRYHPDWEPSWKKSGKAFSATEDGQPSLVSAVSPRIPVLIFPTDANSNGCSAPSG